MTAWNQLFARFGDADRRRQERDAQREHDSEAIRAFEAWCGWATEQIMHELSEAIAARSRALEHSTGARVLLRHPSHNPFSIDRHGAAMHFLHLALHDAQLHVYAFRGPGRLPFVHFIPTRRNSVPGPMTKRNRTLVSLPACFVARGASGGYELRRIPGHAEGDASERITVDEIAYRAFSLLLEMLELGT